MAVLRGLPASFAFCNATWHMHGALTGRAFLTGATETGYDFDGCRPVLPSHLVGSHFPPILCGNERCFILQTSCTVAKAHSVRTVHRNQGHFSSAKTTPTAPAAAAKVEVDDAPWDIFFCVLLAAPLEGALRTKYKLVLFKRFCVL